MPRPKYDVDAKWDDPYERTPPPENRASKRIMLAFKISIGVNVKGSERPLVGPGLVENMSSSGALCVTKHRLRVGQPVMVRISTELADDAPGLPKFFMDTGVVMRVDSLDAQRCRVAIQFQEALSQDIQFALFIDRLQGLADLHSSM